VPTRDDTLDPHVGCGDEFVSLLVWQVMLNAGKKIGGTSHDEPKDHDSGGRLTQTGRLSIIEPTPHGV
jgi:hypothetical protein